MVLGKTAYEYGEAFSLVRSAHFLVVLEQISLLKIQPGS